MAPSDERFATYTILLDPVGQKWTRAAGIGAALGYLASGASNLLDDAARKAPSDFVAAAVILAAVTVTWRGQHVRAGAFVMVATVWCEIHYSFVRLGDLNSASLAALPALVVATAFLGARRVAVAGAVVTAVTAPLASEIGRWLDPSVPGIGDPTAVVVLAASLFVLAQMTNLVLHGREVALRSLIASERRLADVFATIPDGLLAIDAAGTVEVANQAALATLGREATSVEGRPATEVLATIGATTDGAVTIGEGELARHLEVQTVHLEQGRAVVLLRDVTERRRAELRQGALDQQLRAARHLETLGQFAGGIAHDMNNMLQATFGALDELDATLAPSDAGAARTLVGELRQVWNRGASVVRQLLAFARQRPTHSSTVPVARTLERLAPLLRRLVPEDVAFDLQVRAEGAYLDLDPAQFEQMIVNLVANARDAVASRGRVRVTARVEDGPSDARRLVLEVADDGSGMTDEVKARLFEPFFTTKPAGHGTGLGLAMVYGTVKHARGDIQVDSAPGRGTTFTLTFPVCAKTHRSLDPDGATPRAHGETVLVIDDEPLVRRATIRALKSLGYRVLEAASGAEGVAVARREHVDLVVTDVVMPEMGGPEAVARIAEVQPTTRALFLSGYSGDLLDARGAANVLSKPYTIQDLSTRVRATLDA